MEPYLLLLLAILGAQGYRDHVLQRVYAWRNLDYEFPDSASRQEAIRTGVFMPNNTLAQGVERWRDKLFITVPRWRPGVPATLTFININNKELSPALIPYPNWRTNSYRSEDEAPHTVHITSTYRIRVDPCDRLWVMDSGFAGGQKVSAPQVLVFDLTTDNLVRNYFLHDSDYRNDSSFANIIVDVTSSTCDDAYAYMPDLLGYGLVVYSFKTNTSWRVRHQYFYFDPLQGNYTIAGINYQWSDGIFGVALSETKRDGFRRLYFHPLSSNQQFEVSTEVLRNRNLSTRSFNKFKHLGSRGQDSQATGNYYDEKTGVLFLLEFVKHAVTCWNAREKPLARNIEVVAAKPNSSEFIYQSDIRGDRDGVLWIISNKLPVYMYSQVDNTQYNSLVYKAYIKEAIKGTVCQSKRSKRRIK